MRVIAGSARRIQLKSIEGMDTRPTTDRIKETLFNMIQNKLADCEFLDLFSGSGAIGIEALSRGAAKAVFVEESGNAAACIRDNLKTTRLEGQAVVMNCDALTALKRLEEKGNCFDLIFMDPPYDMELERRVLEYLSGSALIGPDTVMIAEASLKTDFSYLSGLGLAERKTKKYKTNKHIIVGKGD